MFELVCYTNVCFSIVQARAIACQSDQAHDLITHMCDAMRFDCGCGLVDLGMFNMLIGLGSFK